MYVKLLKEKQMKKGLKIAAIVVGVIIILMLLLPFAFQGKIAGIVKTEGNKMLNAQFDFKKLNISLFRNFPQASVTLEDFWLKGAGEFANDTLVQAGEVTATINLFSLFGDSGYDISKVFIEDTRLHAIVLPDGHVNWDIMKPDTTDTQETPATEEESSPFKVKLQRFVIKNMNLIYDDQQGKMYADIRDFNALCAGDLGSDRTTLKLEAETKSLTYKMNGIPFLANANISANMDVDADLANNKYTLKDNTIRLNAIQAGIDGWVELKDPAIDMDLMHKELPHAEIVNADAAYEEMRFIKMQFELDRIISFGSNIEEVIYGAFASARAGMTEKDIYRFISNGFAEIAKGDKMSMPMVGSGVRSCLLNGEPTDKVLEKGDIVRVDDGHEGQLLLRLLPHGGRRHADRAPGGDLEQARQGA